MTDRFRTLVDLPGGTVDLRTGVGTRGGRKFELTDTEINLLRYLVQRPEQVVDKAELLTAVWHFHPRASSRAVDTAVRRLRSKIGDGEDDAPTQIRTTRYVGYSFHPIRAGSRRRPPRRMFGRDALITRIRTGLEHGPVWLFGLRGVGKTAAAAAIAGESRRRVAWVDAGGRASVDELFVAIARVLQLHDAASVRLALERWIEPLLIVLDDVDARGVNDWAAFEAMSSDIDLLVTSVESPEWSWPLVLPVSPLELEPAVSLLRARGALPEEYGDRDVLREVVTLVGALPLGIEVAGSMLARTDPVALAASLRLAVPERLQHVLSAAIDQVGPRARWAVIHLAVFEGRSVPLDLAVEVLAPEAGSADLDELVNASLVEWLGDAGRVRVLRPVTACTAADWASSPDRERVRRRHRDVLAERAVAWSAPSVPAAALVPWADEIAAAAAAGPLDDSHAPLLVCLHRAWFAGGPDPEPLFEAGAPEAGPAVRLDLLCRQAELVALHRPYEEGCALLERAIALAREQGWAAQVVQLRARWALMALGSEVSPAARAAVGEAEIGLASLPPSERGAAEIEVWLARARLDQHDGRLDQAIAGLQLVHQRTAAADPTAAAGAVVLVAACHAARGDLPAAVRTMDDAIALAVRAGLPSVELIYRDHRLGWLLPDPARADRTVAELEELERDAMSTGLVAVSASARLSRGILALAARDSDQALLLLGSSRDLLEVVGRPNMAADAEGLLGLHAHEQGRTIEALGHYRRASSRRAVWRPLVALLGGGPWPDLDQADARTTAIAQACRYPARPRATAFYNVAWWPALDRILKG